MERNSVRELRRHASHYFDEVRAGKTIEVTDRGQLVALLVPPTPEQSPRDRFVAEAVYVQAPRRSGSRHDERPEQLVGARSAARRP